MNEKTIYETNQQIEGKKEVNKDENPWKLVTLGGVTGVLMGAGLLYGGQMAAKELDSAESPEADAPEAGETSHTLENGLKVAAVNDDLSFGEAFAQARAEVGPGGVFHWHGGIYNTYTAAEWNAMTIDQKHDFAQQVKPEISANEVPTPTDANTHIVVEHHVYHHDSSPSANDAQKTEDVQVVSEKSADADSDVHIVGYGEVKGHAAVGLDMDGDGQADVAIIDVDDNQRLSDPDIVVDKEGNYATYGEIVNGLDPNMTTSNEAPDMPEDPSADAGYPMYDV